MVYRELPVRKMAALLPVTERTIQRYAPKEHFDRVVSEYILHINPSHPDMKYVKILHVEVYKFDKRLLQ